MVARREGSGQRRPRSARLTSIIVKFLTRISDQRERANTVRAVARIGWRPCRPVYLAALLVVVCGCNRGASPARTATEQAKAFGALPGLKASPDEALQDALAQVVAEGGTPELLATASATGGENAAAALVALFEGLDHQAIGAIRAEVDELFPEGRFTFSPVQLERALRVGKRYEKERLGARVALELPECRFPIAFEAGPAADLGFLDMAVICSRLEAFRAAEALAVHDVDTALESLRQMLRMAECLAAEPHATVRLEAAFLRTDAFLVLQAIAGDEGFQRRHAELAHGLLMQQLQRWPDDALAWIGDRSAGMIFYEAVRSGQLEDFLTEAEIERLKEEDIFSEFEQAALRNVNGDELYYLTAMGRILESCEHPYHTRIDVFEDLRRDLHNKRNDADFPLLAGRFLLLDIEKGHVIQARDRANCEGWAIATALAAGLAAKPIENNPLTGQPYRIERDGGTILVSDIGTGEQGDNPPWIIPDLSGPAE